MLHAILLNKAGRSLTSNEVNWRQLFTASEDSLTSTVFGSLFHLPIELFWQILNDACYEEKLAHHASKILSVEFWPHWSANNSNNINFIEPDIFIRTENFDLIIEAKRFDEKQQSITQWKTEFQGYLTEYGEDKKNVILLAVGGIDNEQPETITLKDNNIRVIKCRWMRILHEVQKVESKLEKSRHILNSIDSTLMILNDIIMGFGIHGYATGNWLEDEDFSKLTQIKFHN